MKDIASEYFDKPGKDKNLAVQSYYSLQKHFPFITSSVSVKFQHLFHENTRDRNLFLPIQGQITVLHCIAVLQFLSEPIQFNHFEYLIFNQTVVICKRDIT